MIALFRRLIALFCATALVASQSAALAHAMAENPYAGEYIADIAEFSTVTVLSKDGYGSGFFIDNRLFVTNYHVIEGGEGAVRFYTQIPRKGYNYSEWVAGKGLIVAVDRQSDLALVLTEKSYNYPLKVEKTSSQTKNSAVIIVGSPEGRAATFSKGLYVGKKQIPYGDGDFNMLRNGIELFGLGLPGSSGGPVLIQKSSKETFSVIGVYSANNTSENSGFAILSEKIWDLYNQNKIKVLNLKDFDFSKANTALNQRLQNITKGNEFFYALELYISKKYRESYGLFKTVAEQGDKNAQYMLGHMYLLGQGIDKNYKNTAYWHQKSGEQGNRASQAHLGRMYWRGEGVAQSYEKAVYWLEKAAEQGEIWAQDYLGHINYHGMGVAKNYKKAAYWNQKAAEQGYAWAQTKLGKMYESGNGVSQSYKKAIYWFKKAAEQGEKEAQKKIKELKPLLE